MKLSKRIDIKYCQNTSNNFIIDCYVNQCISNYEDTDQIHNDAVIKKTMCLIS